MKLVRHLLDKKGRSVISIAPDASVLDAIRLMGEKDIGSLAVMDGDDLVGIVTERDYARKVILKGRGSDTTPVAEIMTATVLTTRPDATVDSCMQMMSDRKFRHLPVVEGERVVGMLSIVDLIREIVDQQRQQIEQLEQYISG
jgi:CBS domain-containing protein